MQRYCHDMLSYSSDIPTEARGDHGYLAESSYRVLSMSDLGKTQEAEQASIPVQFL